MDASVLAITMPESMKRIMITPMTTMRLPRSSRRVGLN
jgi:hypothetical protein